MPPSLSRHGTRRGRPMVAPTAPTRTSLRPPTADAWSPTPSAIRP